ncbi:Organic cation/carnitine transporter 2 [Hibiscus syriacus]|uniref:Organic cation/carnitine transporter 2 n=1 Tax=Hibiscus syriacus TaxID=106335 RepID=A0A6A2ZQ70_HIBSY|nr:Organic cation/carnitine transporter 2 [Hibiscus syriacus]
MIDFRSTTHSPTRFITGLPASSFFMGCLLGGLVLATLADSTLGRKNMLLLSCLMMSLSSFTTVFSSNIWIYSALRFINGFGRATVGTSSLVLATELVGKRWRGQVGRKEEAVKTLKSMAANALTSSFSNVLVQQESMNDNIYTSIKIMLNKEWAAQRLAAVMATCFGIGMVYYGMPLALGNLSVNVYLGVTLNALFELPTSLITFFFIGKINRKDSLLGFTILSGVCSVLCLVMGRVRPSLQIAMELISFFSACGAFNMSLIYTLELFPTCVRNSAVSMTRQALVLGGVFGPLLVAAGRKNDLISFGVFGIVIGVCGLPLIGLPDTRGGTICDTMDEEELKQNQGAAAATPTLV